MPRTTFPSLPPSPSISPQPGPRTTLTSSCWSSCSQASALSTETRVVTRVSSNGVPSLACCWVSTDGYLPFPHSWSVLLFQQPVRRQDLHHHVWSHQHVLLSCHGMSCTEPHASQRTLQRALHLFAFGIRDISTRRWRIRVINQSYIYGITCV